MSSSKHRHCLIVNLILQSKELTLLDIIANSCKQAGKHQTEVDGQRLDGPIVVLVIIKKGKEQVDGRSPC